MKGSGAGMEPPPDARLERRLLCLESGASSAPEILLRRDPQAGDWRLCAAGRCAALGEWLGRDADPVRLSASLGDGCKR